MPPFAPLLEKPVTINPPTGTCRDVVLTPDAGPEEYLALEARVAAHDLLAKFVVDFRPDVEAASEVDIAMLEAALDYDPAAQAILDVLLGYLHALLADEQGQTCPGLLPAPLTNAVRVVVCLDCYTKADIRAVIRLGRRPSVFEARRLKARPEHFARLAAVVVGTVVNHRADPLAVVEYLDTVVYPGLRREAA